MLSHYVQMHSCYALLMLIMLFLFLQAYNPEKGSKSAGTGSSGFPFPGTLSDITDLLKRLCVTS